MEKYHMFLEVMTDFKNQRIDAGGVIARVKDLFKGYPNLILGFNTFLPNGNKITFNDDDDDPLTKSIEFEQSVSLVKKIKKRFRNADHVYKSFINILGMFRKENKDIKEVYDEIVVLLNGHSDLLDELSKFFPDSATVNPFPLKCFPLGSTIGPHAEIDRNMHHHTDEKKSVHMVKEFGGPHEDMYNTFCEKVKERLRSPGDYRSFLKCLHIYNKGKITRKELQSLVANILGQYPDLMEGFNDFIDRYERVDESKEVRNEKKCKTEAPTKEAISFLKKVKEHFQNDDHAYQSFLDIIKTYKEPRSIYEVYREVAKLLNDHPDLLSEFTKFLPDS
ncbi:paired amphipathic helix protein Sin3-like 2 [Lycium barbarum]|uniref:paired amphipathic helix protein Sin3-like 2 n=1 Tax=Lycium barbarum TaxID=112863 RepID=UPI00293EE7B3|nr:paired amphipathic helix protein Sin3-like 2 [Lycium barbarum]